MTSLKAQILYKELQNLSPELKKKLLPQKGVDYFTDEEINQIVSRFKPILGKDYYNGLDGRNGRDGINGMEGKQGKSGRDGKNGADGKDAVIDEEKIVTLLMEKIGEKLDTMDFSKYIKIPPGTNKQALAKWGAQHLRHGGGDILYTYDLSSQLNGVLKVFTIPVNRKVSLVISSSVPFVFRPIVDYTVTKNSITFTSGVDAASMLAGGQSLLIHYVL